MREVVRWAWLFVLTPILAGCVAPAPTGPTPLQRTPEVYIALVDTGINPYHEAFAWSGADRPGVSAQPVPASFRQKVADLGLEAWDELEADTLYWFEGTRVLAISLTRSLPLAQAVFPPDPHPIVDDQQHGSGTATVATRAAPHAWIVMVETSAQSLGGYLWASEQEWIDIISTSLSNLGHAPNDPGREGGDRYADSLRNATRRGKLVVSAGGNYPDPNLLSGENSPPWVISVGGAEGEDRGTTPLTSQPVDVVADFTWWGLARNDHDTETWEAKGTSFSAPWVAGQLAEALYQVRLATGHRGPIADGALVRTPDLTLSNADFRRALNVTAVHWDTTDHRPQVNTSEFPTALPYELTAPAAPHAPGTPVGPWLHMGWGYVGDGAAQAMADLLLGRVPAPDKADAAAHMEQLHEARAALWELRQG
jgi:hypothetical protein